jgi:hypothetical protein
LEIDNLREVNGGLNRSSNKCCLERFLHFKDYNNSTYPNQNCAVD